MLRHLNWETRHGAAEIFPVTRRLNSSYYALPIPATCVAADLTITSPPYHSVLFAFLSLAACCSYVFHYMVEDGITYLCLADEQQKRRIPFLFLQDVKERCVPYLLPTYPRCVFLLCFK